MADSIAINEVKLSREEIDIIEASVIVIPKLSVGHSESLRVKLFAVCGLVSIYYRNRFYCLPTQESQEDVISVLSERIKDLSAIEEKMPFSDLDEAVKERLLVELFRHAASKANYFAIYERIFLRAERNINPFFTLAFELTLRQFEDSYGYFINPTHLSITNCTRLSSRLREEDRLIRLCSKRSKCSLFLKEKKCKYSYPSYIGFLSEYISRNSENFDSELKNLKEFYDECPGVEGEDFGILIIKRTKNTKTERVYPSFLAFRELTREERRSFDIETEFRNKLLLPSSVRYLHTKTIIDNIFKNDSMSVNDLDLPVIVELRNFHELSEEGIVVGLEEPLLQFDPIKEDLSIEPSSLFYKGVYDASSTARPFSAIKPYVILPTAAKKNLDRILDWLANGKTYIDPQGLEKTEFVGLNHRWSRFNCRFVLPEKNEYFYADKEEDFLESARTIVNQWKHDNERIILIVLPGGLYEEEEEERYGEYRKPFSLYY